MFERLIIIAWTGFLLVGCAPKRPFTSSAPILGNDGAGLHAPETSEDSTSSTTENVADATTSMRVLAYSQQTKELYARFIDVGGGLCVVAQTPEGKSLVFDAGHWTNTKCAEGVEHVLGPAGRIDLLILSHGDGDHIGNVPQILENHKVKTIIWTGDERTSKAWGRAATAIGEAAGRGTTVYSLQTHEIVPGETYNFGSAKLTLVTGWGEPPWTEGLSEGELSNFISIVAKLTYGERSLLLTGDTIGRNGSAPNEDEQCSFAEGFMVESADQLPLKGDVLQAPHHGGKNGSSHCFIRAVQPDYVIFSSGHNHEHPRQATADRYIGEGVRNHAMLRTDRGDNELGPEWSEGAGDCADQPGDDDIEVFIPVSGPVRVAYAGPDDPC